MKWWSMLRLFFLEDFELLLPNREQVQEVITLARNYALSCSYVGFEMVEDENDEFLSMNPPPPMEISAPMQTEASAASHPPAAGGEAVVPLEDGDEGSVVVDGAITITLDTPLRVIRMACES